MKIAIEGCAHGELEKIYDTIAEIERRENYKVDLLLCCGDFQSTRNMEDLNCMAIPKKFHDMCSFYKYYSGEKVAPILTIFIGGNHEASNYLQELPYGGWVAPNVYYLGYAGVVQVNGIRIGGVSGIYKGFDYYKGHYEISPYDENTKRSVYHIRQLEVFRMKQLSSKVDIMMSHDWPRGVYNFGNSDQLCRFKPHFKEEIANNKLGSPPCEDLLNHLRPDYWFSAHLHCKFSAIVPHQNPEGCTKFLALDKCLPRRRFLQVLDFPDADESRPIALSYDLEWMTILRNTKHLIDVKSTTHYMPGPGSPYRFNFTPTDEEKSLVLDKLSQSLLVPLNFTRTAEPFDPQKPQSPYLTQPNAQLNPQTTALCDRLDIDDPVSLVMLTRGLQLNHSSYRERTSELDDSNASLNQSNTTDSSFNTSTECGGMSRKRSEFTLPAPMNESNNIALDDDDEEEDISRDEDASKDDRDFVVEEITEIDPSSLNSTLSTSFTLIRPSDKRKDVEESTAETNTSLSDVASLLSSAVNIESSMDDSKAGECNNIDKPGNLNNEPIEKPNTSELEGISPPKKFKRRNQEIYASTED